MVNLVENVKIDIWEIGPSKGRGPLNPTSHIAS